MPTYLRYVIARTPVTGASVRSATPPHTRAQRGPAKRGVGLGRSRQCTIHIPRACLARGPTPPELLSKSASDHSTCADWLQSMGARGAYDRIYLDIISQE